MTAFSAAMRGAVDPGTGGTSSVPRQPGATQAATVHDGPGRRERRDGRVRAGEPDDLVPGGDELADDRGPYVSGHSGDEYAHARRPLG